MFCLKNHYLEIFFFEVEFHSSVIYGHCFGFEIFHTFSPLENINSLIVISIVAGVFIISFGFFILMFIKYNKKNN